MYDDELALYRTNRILIARTNATAQSKRLQSALNANIRSVQQLRLLSTIKKNAQINSLISLYNREIIKLRQAMDQASASVNAFVPRLMATSFQTKRALLVGINYTGTSNELYGCVNDMTDIQTRLQSLNFGVTRLTDTQATRTAILAGLASLLSASNLGDVCVFAFSGHGSNRRDTNGDELDGQDELIVTTDNSIISDDELNSIIRRGIKPGVTLFVLFDSCFSGTAIDLKYTYSLDLSPPALIMQPNISDINEGSVIMISGCTDNQTSADAWIDSKANGAMTWSLLKTLTQPRTYACTWRQLVTEMRALLLESGFDQIPQLSTGRFENIDSLCFL
jgi:hypothetical protein